MGFFACVIVYLFSLLCMVKAEASAPLLAFLAWVEGGGGDSLSRDFWLG